MRWRILTVIIGFGILYLVLLSKLYDIQFNKSAYYSAQAESQNIASGLLKATRGNIYFIDKNNKLIQAVLNKDYATIIAVPKDIQESARSYAEKLAPILNLSVEELEEKLSKPDDSYELLIQKATYEQVSEIREMELEGIYIKNESLRFYPFGSLASHLLGFVAPDENDKFSGRYGVELFFNDLLAGKSGESKGDKIIGPQDGQNVILTIDRNIQAQAEEVLKKLITEKSAEDGSVIIQEPSTGKILAMASFPDFNPNNYSQYDLKNFLNPAVQAVYEPGSVFKVITMAAGIDSGKITPETIYVDTGSVTYNGRTIKNWDNKAHGKQTMTGVIEQSINTGAVFAERKTGHDIFYNYLLKFGLNEKTGINLPGELKGNINNLKKNRDINFATASFGQGVSVTPIGLITAVSALANDGVLMKPLITSDEKPQVLRKVISSETAKAVTRMMVSAVKKNVIADIPNYSVAGKTGTAFIPDFVKGGYTDDVINTYAGFAPASQPEFTILIKLTKPAGAPLAGQTVVPAFRELAEFILNYYNISPDNL
ncbi:MAG: penicillin-binding protein 2 [Patescibacteria group bacterium]